MKYAICNELFHDRSLEAGFQFAHECGYTGIELAPFTLAARADLVTPVQREQVVQLARRYELEIVGLHWLLAKTEGYHLTTGDHEVRKRTSDYLAHLARLCRDCGGRVLVLGSPQQRNLPEGMSHEQGMQHAAEVIERILPVLEQTETTLALEPLGPSEGNFLLTADAAVQLARQIGSPHVGLHLDVKAMSSETESIPDLIRRHADQLVHFHANDPNRQGPGMGEVDFVPIFAALRDIDYPGWVSVEVFDYSPGVENLARTSLENMRRAATG